MSTYFKCLFLGLMVAIPIGPVGLLVIQRSIKLGSLRGIISGLGAALADGLFGFLAAAGLSALVEQLETSRPFIHPLGSLILASVGIYFYFQKPRSTETKEVLSARHLHRYLWDLLSVFSLTLMNPATVLAFTALIAGSDLISLETNKMEYLEITAGIFSGSFLWWLLLVFAAQPLKKKLSTTIERRIQKTVGIILVVLAILSLAPRVGIVIDKLKTLMGGIL